MIGILIVTHGKLSESLLESASMFVTNTDAVRPVCFFPGEGLEDLIASMRTQIKQLASEDGILVLVDLPGGSPAKAAGALLLESNARLEAVSGVNLPMLVEVLMLRESMTLSELARYAVVSGNEGIVDIGQMLAGG